jgi:hypothetical protein
MYKQVLIPDKKNHSIEMPEQFFGNNPAPPAGKKTTINELLESFGAAPDFPTTDEIRAKAWASKW